MKKSSSPFKSLMNMAVIFKLAMRLLLHDQRQTKIVPTIKPWATVTDIELTGSLVWLSEIWEGMIRDRIPDSATLHPGYIDGMSEWLSVFHVSPGIYSRYQKSYSTMDDYLFPAPSYYISSDYNDNSH